MHAHGYGRTPRRDDVRREAHAVDDEARRQRHARHRNRDLAVGEPDLTLRPGRRGRRRRGTRRRSGCWRRRGRRARGRRRRARRRTRSRARRRRIGAAGRVCQHAQRTREACAREVAEQGQHSECARSGQRPDEAMHDETPSVVFGPFLPARAPAERAGIRVLQKPYSGYGTGARPHRERRTFPRLQVG
ncbi:MAG: hypothetical protein E6G26_07445 [Actinobacteria bacterium]|nr:MAG: hypothetical protein E6G26_07445 [Actinomycetota bacterium]